MLRDFRSRVINPGDLRHQITIYSKSVALNAYNEEIVTWAEVVTTWAKIRPKRGHESLDGAQTEDYITTEIYIRHIEGITPTMRVVCGDDLYLIVEVINVNQVNRELLLNCQKIHGTEVSGSG